jgi:hypothetical protein
MKKQEDPLYKISVAPQSELFSWLQDFYEGAFPGKTISRVKVDHRLFDPITQEWVTVQVRGIVTLRKYQGRPASFEDKVLHWFR